MSADFSNITILGGGLLGGSLAMALAALEPPPRVRLWARKQATVDAASLLGIREATCDLAAAVAATDLLVLAVPVGLMAGLVAQALQAGLSGTRLVTDVGSVKRAPHQSIPPVLAGSGIHFIGSHPMAGSERVGIAAAHPRMFDGAACLLTNDNHAPAALAESLDRFWQTIGCLTSWMSARNHDALVARISHLPHILAASAARICLRDPLDGRFGGGGLRDTTRISSGPPDMWAEILIENREALMGPLRETIADLGEILAHLENAGQEPAQQWLATAKQLRDRLQPPC
jgi:prephenate dehydrogenase